MRKTAPRSYAIAVVGAIIGLIGVVALVVFVLDRGTSSGDIQVQLGDQTFSAGSADQRARSIREGGPILLPDPAGGTRDIYLQHLSDQDTEGWLAFDSRVGGTGRECTLQWDPQAQVFNSPCGGPPVPADGTGLVRYPVEVTEDGLLIVDIRAGRAGTGG